MEQEKIKEIVRTILELQTSILINGATKGKIIRIEKELKKLGFTDNQLEGVYSI